AEAINYNRVMKRSPEQEAIRRQVLLGLARNRTLGFHYPAHFLGLEYPRIGADDLEETLPDSPQCRNVDGSVNLVALCVLLDTALAGASRLKAEPGVRQATVNLHVQFTGVRPVGAVAAHASHHGFTAGAVAREGITSGEFSTGGSVVCRANGTFIVLPPPP